MLDVRHAIDLQKWYLNKTLGDNVQIRDWPVEDQAMVGSSHWHSRSKDEPLWVDLVDGGQRDAFVHAYGRAHASARLASSSSADMPLRVLFAVNSWHEFHLPEYLWYYNTFVTGPSWLAPADYIFYVSNREWDMNSEKEKLLLEPWPGPHLEVVFEDCNHITCERLFRRIEV